MSPRHRRTVAVSGSASGIGAAVRARMERSGTKVVGIDLAGAEVKADLSHPEGRAEALEALNELTDDGLDGLVVCAGLGPHVRDAARVVGVNYFGALALLDDLLHRLAEGQAASAVAIASNSAGLTPPDADLLAALAEGNESAAAERAGDLDGATVYGMTKLALARAVRRRAGRWGKAGVRLNAVCPGPIDTPLLAESLADETLGPLVEALPIPLSRRGTPDEVAAAVSFLLDPVNGYVHGSILFVDGGSDALLRPDVV